MELLSIKEVANFYNISEQTIRRKIKGLSEKDKSKYLKEIKLKGRGGIKILLSNSFVTDCLGFDLQPIQLDNQQPIQLDNQQLVQVEFLRAQIIEKDKTITALTTTINELASSNHELSSRIKEVNYLLALKGSQPPQEQNAPPTHQEQNTLNKNTVPLLVVVVLVLCFLLLFVMLDN